MAIRYSGDVEVRVQWTKAGYVGTIRAPGYRQRFRFPLLSRKRSRPEDYDAVVHAILGAAERQDGLLPLELDGRGRLVVRRVFQSACPRK